MSANKRITKKDLEEIAKSVNSLTNKINVKVSYRYGYVAIDLYYKDGKFVGTLVSGLTKSQAYEILESMYNMLRTDKSFSQ